MKKHLLTYFLSALSISCFGQYSMFQRAYNPKIYRIAITLTNPASAMVKYGGGVEYVRLGHLNTSYMLSYYKYVGAYYGTQYNAEYRIYLNKVYEHRNNNWRYQGFFYGRSIVGQSGYDGEAFAFLGQKEKKYSDPLDYFGGSLGMGRKYWKGHFFFNVKGGLRLVTIPDLQSIDRSLYRLFYLTGPGSYFELNFQFGLQIW